MKNILYKIWVFVSLWLILSSISETLFYEVNITWEYYIFILLYGLYGYTFILLNHYYKVASFAWLFISACIFWFLIEWGLVGVLYEALPFSIIWTSLAWHVLITVFLFWYYFRKIMLEASVKIKTLYSVFLGLILWLWWPYSWSAWEDPLTREVSYSWTISPAEYGLQIIFWFLLFLLGHYIYERCIDSMKQTSNKELYIVGSLVLLSFIIGNGILYFPFSLILIVLIAPCWYLVKKNYKASNKIFTSSQDTKKISLSSYIISLLIPVVTIGSYYIFFISELGIEMNVLYFTVGWLISLYLLVKSSIKLMRA